MKTKLRKLLAMLMTLAMFISSVPTTALAAIVPVSGGTQTSSGISLQSVVIPPVATTTYVFMNGANEFARQILKNGEELNNPGTPTADSANKEFVGWFDESGNQLTFPITASVGSASSTITVTARFADVYFVFFTNEKGEVMVTKKGTNGETISTDGVTYPVGNEQSIVGWKDESGNAVTSVTLTDHDVTLTAIVENGHWITYDSQGGTYVAPAFVKGNGKTTAPANPSRPGYAFDHWSETVGGAAFTFGNALTTALTLYAVWTPNSDTNYTVIHWWENANDDGYTYHESETKSGTTGELTAAVGKTYTVTGTNVLGQSVRDQVFTAQTIQQQTIAGDGSTIVNVYYSRKSYTITFRASNWSGYTTLKTLTKKWGENLQASDWYTYNGDNNYEINGSSRMIAFLSTMPMNGATLNAKGDRGSTNTATYYGEALSSSQSGAIQVSGRWFIVHHTDTTKGTSNYTVGDEDRYPIEGFTLISNMGTQVGERYGNAKFYYSRNSYNVIYYNGDGVDHEVSYKYEEDISNAGNYEPANPPAGVSDTFKFDGWYMDPDGSQKYDFSGKTMPVGGVVVYAKWVAPTSIADVFTTIIGGSSETIDPIPYGGTITERLNELQATIMANNPGYTWRGWRTGANGTGDPFNVDTKIYSDITLYPYYTKDGTFSVEYKSGKDDVTAPTDSKKYAEDSYADLMTPDKLVSDDGQYFLGWTDGQNTYQPRDKYQIKDNVTFTGVWGARPATVSLTYKANGGVEADQTIDSIANNDTVTTIENPFTRAGYSFVGWDTSANGTGSIKAGTDVQVDNDGENVLYAIWTANTNTKYTVEFYYQNTDGTYTLNHSDERTATTDTTVSVTDADKAAKENNKYVFEADNKNNVLSGIVKGDESLVLKLYFKLNTATYVIHHYLKGTEVKVANDETGVMNIGAEITAHKRTTLDDTYTVDSYAPTQTITIVADSKQNVITVYYTVPLTITAKNADKDYDGTPLTQPDFDIAGLVNGDTKEDFFVPMTKESTITDAGEQPNVIDELHIVYTGKTSTGGTIPSYYNVKCENGTLTVNKAAATVTITGVQVTHVYDGNVHEANGYNYSFSGKPGDIKIAPKADVSTIARRTDVGKTEMGLTKDSFVVTSKNYEVTIKEVIDGYVEITPITTKIIIVADSNSKTYDGTPLTDSGFSYTAGVLVSGDKLEADVEGSQINFGSSDNVVKSYKVMRGDVDVTKNYTFGTSVNGTLTVKKRTVTLTSGSADKVYDGTPLTNSKVTIGGEGFATGEGATFDVTGTITNVGKVDNTFTYTLNEGTDANNYTITTTPGELEVTPVTDKVTVTIIGNTNEKLYDGTEKSASGYGHRIAGSKVYTSADFRFTGATKEVKGTDADTYNLGLKAEQFENINKNFTNVEFVIERDTSLTINRRVVTLIPEEGHKTYDGTPLTRPDVTETGDGFVDGEVSNIKANGSVTHVYEGKVLNNVTYTTGANFKETNYNITIAEKYLWIDPVEDEVTVTIKGHTATATYDGDEHTVSGYDVESISNKLYTENDFDFNGKAEKTAIDADSYPMGLDKSQFVNNNRNFNKVTFVVTDGNLTINKRNVTFTGETDTKTYTGTEQKLTGITAEGLVDGHTFSGLEYEAKGTNVGSYDGAFRNDVVIKDAQGNDVTKNYNVDPIPGTLTITNAQFVVKFTGDSATKVYNGEEQSITGITVEGLKPGHKYVEEDLSYEAKGTEKGEYKGAFTGTVKILDENDVDVTENYAITKTPGTLTITAYTTEVVVTITGHKASATYDGAEHTAKGYDVSINNTLYKEEYFTFSGTDEVTDTNAGTYPMGLKVSDFQNNSENFAKVTFVVKDGELVINKRKVTVTAVSLERDYVYGADGPVAYPEDTFMRYEVEYAQADGDTGLLPDDTMQGVTVLYDGEDKQTLIGVYDAVAQLAAAKITNAKDDVTDNYEIVPEDGKLTIKGNDPLDPKKETTSVKTNYTVGDEITYTITVKNVSKDEAKNVVVTDGMAEILADENNLYTVSADGHTATIASIPAGGTVLVKAKHIVTAEDVENAYANNGDGTLTNVANIHFDNKDQQVTGDSDKLNNEYRYFVYYYWEGYVDANGDRVEVKTSERGTATVGGEVTEKPADVPGYTPVSTDSKKLTISADESKNVIAFYYYKNVVLTANSDEKVYNGSEWTVKGFTIEGKNTDAAGNEIPADFSAITVGAKGTDVGTYPADFAEGTVGTVDKNKQYIVVEANNGQLVITPITEKTITITAASDEKVYDGTALTNNGFKYTEGVLVSGDELTAVVEGSATNVGDAGVNKVMSYKVTRNGKDVTKNYTFTDSVDGKLTINKRKVTLTSKTASKEYDGTPLTRPDVTMVGSFVDGEVTDIKATGSVTYVAEGTVKNTIEYTKNASFKEDNYDIEEQPGTLTITAKAAKITITANSADKTYDGKALTDSGFSYEGTLVDGDELTAVVEGSQTNSGSSDNIVTSYKVTRNGKDVTDNYTFNESEKGTLKVTPVAIELTAASDEKAYDGTPLTNSEYTISKGAFVSGEGLATVTIVGSQTLVGSSANVIKGHTLKEGTLAQNYDIKYVDGELKVTQNEKTITITANSHTWEYDGQPHSDGGYTVNYDGVDYKVEAGDTATLPTGDVVKATVEGTVTNVSDSADDNNVVTNVTITNKAGTVVNGQYKTIETVKGGLKITKRGAGDMKVVLTAANNTVTYNGQPHGAKRNDKDEIEVGISYTITNLAEGHSVKTVAIDGSQTAVGKYPNELVPSGAIIVDKNGNDVTANYEVSYVKGDLEITSPDTVIVTIKGKTDTAEYDGTMHEVNGYEVVKISNDLYTKDDFGFADGATAHAEGTDAGDYFMNLTKDSFVNKNPNFTSVTFVVEDGKLTITKRGLDEEHLVKIIAADNTVYYDGQPHGAKLNAAGQIEVGTSYTTEYLADGHKVKTVAIDGSETMVGVYKDKLVPNAAIIVDEKDNDVTENYVITYVPGTLEIKKNETEIKVTANSHTWEYDGQPHSDGGYTVEYDGKKYEVPANGSVTLPTGDTVTATVEGSVTNVADSKKDNNVVTNVTIVNAAKQDTKGQYETVTLVPGTLTITKRGDSEDEDKKVKIIAEPNTVGYDGNAHGAKLNAKGEIELGTSYTTVRLVDGHYVDETTLDITGSQTNVGEYKDELKPAVKAGATRIVIRDAEGNDVTDNYALTLVNATLTITGDKLIPDKKAEDEDIESNYKLGDKIEFTITVKNVSIYDVENVEVVDADAEIQAGDDYTVSEDKHTATIASIAAKSEIKIKALHTVTSEDILAGKVGNVANVTWKDGEKTVTKTVDDDTTKLTPPDVTLNVTKTSTWDGKDDGAKLELGTKITYTITVKNMGNVPYTNVDFTDILQNGDATVTGDIKPCETLPVNGEYSFTVEYIVTEADLLKGSIHNKVTAEADEIEYTYYEGETEKTGKVTPKGEAEVTDRTDAAKASTTSTKTTTSTPANGKGYALGETITYDIVVTNDGNLTVTDIEVVDNLAGAEIKAGNGYDVVNGKAVIDELKPGESVTVKAEYVVTEADILAGTVVNDATVTGKGPDKDPDPDKPTTEDDTDKPKATLDIVKAVSGTPKNSASYALGEKITYTLTVKVGADNNVTVKDIKVTDTLLTAENVNKKIVEIAGGYTLNENNEIELPDMAPGANEVVITYTYTVQESDLGSGAYGTVHNAAVSKGTTPDPDPDNPNPKPDDPKDEDDNDTPTNIRLIITAKDHTGIEYDGDAHGENGYDATGLATGHEITSVTISGSRTNVGYYTDELDPSNAVIMEGDVEVTDRYEIEYVKGDLEIIQRGLDENNPVQIIAEPNTVEYDGNAHGAKLNDKDEIELGTSYTTVRLVEGHYVDETTLDITGSQTNVGVYEEELKPAVKAGATRIVIRDADGNDVTDNYALTLVNATLTITGDKLIPDKKAEDEDIESNYKLGDEIEFTITVKNVSIYEVENVEVVDANAEIQAGDGYTVSEDKHTATIASIAAKSEIKIKALHTVTSEDILAGKVGNVANVTWKDGEKTVTKTVDDDTTKLTPPDVTLNVTKTSTWDGKDDGAKLELGTKITYTITVKNMGNVPYTNVDFTDILQNGDATVTGEIKPCETLPVNGEHSFTVEYIVTEADLLKGSIHNKVTAEADEIEYTYYEGETEKTGKVTPKGEAEVTDNTDVASASFTSKKTTTSTPKNEKGYALGETITYEIEVTNDGNLTLTDVEVTEKLAGAVIKASSDYTVSGSVAKIAELKPGQTVIVNVEYVVTEADILAGSVKNVATVKGNGPDDKDPDPKDPGTEDPTDKPKATLDIAKSVVSTPKNGTSYKLGETITYKLTVKVGADNNVTVKDIRVTDTLLTAENVNKKIVEIAGGYTLNAKNEIELPDMAPGATEVVITYTYTVQEGDLGSGAYGTVHNAAVSKGTTPDPKDPDDKPDDPKDEDKKDTPTNIRLVITANNNTGIVYDGEEHGEDGYKQTGLSKDHTIEKVTISGKRTNVGEEKLVPSDAKIVDKAGNDVTSHYDIEYVNATLEIIQKKLTITADSDEKFYDGTPLTKDSYTNTELAKGDEIANVTITGTITEVGSVENVASGAKIVNAAKEDVTGNYDIEYVKGTLTIKAIPSYGFMDLIVTKKWDDANNQDGKRDDVTLTLNASANNKLIDWDVLKDIAKNGANLTMDETAEHVFAKAEFTDDEDSYSYVFRNVPKYANFNDVTSLIDFAVTENAVPEFYEIDAEKSTKLMIVNVHEVKTMDIHVTKVWEDENNNDGYRPDAITVKLYADGELCGEKTITPDENDVWETTFEQLPVYKKGEKIGYTVEEDAIEEYTTTYSTEEPIIGNDEDEAAHEVTITNRYEIKKLSIKVTKIWADAGNQDKLRPSELTFNLYKTVGDGEKELVQEFQLKSSNGNSVWKHKDLRTTLENLNVYENGEKIHYSIEETTVLEGYTVKYQDNDIVGGDKVNGEYQTEFRTWVTNYHIIKRPNRLIGPMGMTSGECVE